MTDANTNPATDVDEAAANLHGAVDSAPVEAPSVKSALHGAIDGAKGAASKVAPAAAQAADLVKDLSYGGVDRIKDAYAEKPRNGIAIIAAAVAVVVALLLFATRKR